MKKFFKKIYSPLTPTLIAAACLTVIAAVSAAVVTLGYADNLVMQAQGVGTLKGAVQFAQSHVTFAKDNSNRTLPNVVQERTSLLLYTPHASDNKIDSMTVVATNGSQQLGTISLSPPQDLPKSDQVNISDKRVEYSTKTWSARLPWYWHKAGLILTLKSNTGLTQTVSGIEFSAPSELVLQHIRIGMLTAAPGPTFLETNPEMAAIDYFQKIPVSRLIVSQYNPINLNKVTLANGTVYTSASSDWGGVYSGDMREYIGKALISTGINLANYGISSSGGTSQYQPAHYMQIVVHHSIGKYGNGVQQHGLSGGNGMATLYGTQGNEFSHELGHNYGLGHYPNGFAGSFHTRTTGWGYDTLRHRMIGNTNPWATDETFMDGQTVGKFGDRPYGKDAMAGGFPMGDVSQYTQHTGYVATVIQKAFETFGVVDPTSSTGYVKWNASSQKMETLVDSNRRKPSEVGGEVATVVGFYDPMKWLPSTVYPTMYGSYGMTYPSQDVPLDASKTVCKLVVTGANAAVLTQSLQGSRVDPYDMNKFHVNIKRALLPAKVNVQCSHAGRWLTLASSNIALPSTPWPKTTKVGGAAGNGALANSNITIAGLEQNYLPLSNIATLRSIINSKLGPIKKWVLVDNAAEGGQIYEYANPYNGLIDYFILKISGKYGFFPTNQTSDATWKFIGTDKGIVNRQPNPFYVRIRNASTADESVIQYYGQSLKNSIWKRSGVVGDIYFYDNPYNGMREYFSLKSTRYDYFPTNGESSKVWDYLTNEKELNVHKSNSDQIGFEKSLKKWYGITAFNNWGDNGQSGRPGSIYVYNHSGRTDYFRLHTYNYSYFPTDQTSNGSWEYIDTY